METEKGKGGGKKGGPSTDKKCVYGNVSKIVQRENILF